MAVNALSLAECLRPWRSAGLFHLMGDEDMQAVPSLSWESDADAQSGAAASPLPPAARKAFAPPAGQAGASSGPRPVAAARSDAPLGGTLKAPSARGRPAGDEARKPITAPEHWPGPWQQIFARTKAAPLIWTYPELGDDLCGPGSAERSAFLRSLLGDLRLPRGSSAFWPMRLPETTPGDRGVEEAAFFQDGLFRLRPKILIMLGARCVALSGLPLSIAHPFTQEIAHGLLVVLLPDFFALLGNAPQAEAACTFLRAALSGMALGGVPT